MVPQHNLPPSTSPGDFVLFEDAYSGYGHSLLNQYPGNSLFQHQDVLGGIPETSYTQYENGSNVSDGMQQMPESIMNKQFHSISSVEQVPGQQTMTVTSSPSYETQPIYSPYQSEVVPRTVGSPFMEPTPNLLIHPPTFPYPPRDTSRHGNHSTPTASPATSRGSRYSGSESGSVQTSPYNRPIGLENHLSEFAFDQSFGEFP